LGEAVHSKVNRSPIFIVISENVLNTVLLVPSAVTKAVRTLTPLIRATTVVPSGMILVVAIARDLNRQVSVITIPVESELPPLPKAKFTPALQLPFLSATSVKKPPPNGPVAPVEPATVESAPVAPVSPVAPVIESP
jgi:hypothetical protein